MTLWCELPRDGINTCIWLGMSLKVRWDTSNKRDIIISRSYRTQESKIDYQLCKYDEFIGFTVKFPDINVFFWTNCKSNYLTYLRL